ncbi:alginate lyase family protein [Paenibacillus terrigena]|uniref:alginate lyase family protein n=1 Tax=Paenibacillus terrigena TaxID=369333 RepID=UPI00038284CD|nr:alginate lyase family protein [Paenibacillus terrigena]
MSAGETVHLNRMQVEVEGLEMVRASLAAGDEAAAYAALHRQYLDRIEPKLYWEESDLDQLKQYVLEQCPHELQLIKKTADEVAANTFVFQFPWDMERTNIPVTFDGAIDWNHIPAEDPEWTYMLNRHRYWIALGQAYVLTGDETYAKTFCQQLEDWIDRNPVPVKGAPPGLTWRSIEAGLRCENWTKAFAYVKRSPHFTPALLAKMLTSLYEHAEYIVATPCEGAKRISNWSVLENHGLFEVSLFMREWKSAGFWQEISEKRLKETTRLQVLKDGLHWEQSPMYHNEVLHCYLDYCLLSRNNGLTPDSEIEATVRKMAYADLYIAKPNHHQPLQGDSDDNDLRDFISAGALYFEDETLKYGGFARLDFENAWTFGWEGVLKYDQLGTAAPDVTSVAFRNTGNYVMRSGWDEQDAYGYFHCGFMGGGHGHADMLHFDIHAYGRDLLTDAGRYNYGDHTMLRRILKQCDSHNTTTVDGIDFSEYHSSWSYGRIAEPVGVQWITEPTFDYVEGSHTGYRYLADPVYPLRRIVFVKPGYWVLADSFDCKEEHTFEQHFHFMPGEVVFDDSNKVCCTVSPDEANLRIIPVHPGRLTGSVRDSIISREYNVVEDNLAVTYQSRATGFTSMIHVLFPQPAGSLDAPEVEAVKVYNYLGHIVAEREAEAVRLTFGEHSVFAGEEHILLICHKVPGYHIDSYVVEGTQVFGEVVLLRRKQGQEEVIVIK